jgi:hypothetical protein
MMDGTVSGWFDELHFTECFLGEPEWRGDAMVAAVRAVFACGEHPLAGEGQPLAGRLVFAAVDRSTRTFYEYADGRTGLRPGCVVIEDGGAGGAADLTDYRFGGVREDPRGWIEWTVRARGFEFEVGPTQA